MPHRLPSKKDLKQLAKFNEPFCVSIYVPYIEPTGSTNPNMIELKNLTRQARHKLADAGLKPSLVEKTLRPIDSLLEGREFWPDQRMSLAIFAHARLFKHFHAPGRQFGQSLANVDNGFNVEPLNNLVEDDKTYMVLAIGHNNVQLYKASRYHIKPVRISGFPADMHKTLRIDELPRVIETHPVSTTERGRYSQTFHGQYNESQTDKTMLLQFFRHINKRLGEVLHGKNIPLVLAGVGYLMPIYRAVNTYPHLVSQGVAGSNETIQPDTIRHHAWNIVSKLKNGYNPRRVGHYKKALK